uniref:HMA domain-containing protein n=1 Tax=Oryza punctata TaxID=4537 RepID=A0A0E0KDM4_ORYPU
MASADAVSPAPATPAAQQQLQTVVLRVSIHCLGCKKKVRKVLRNIEGVKDVKVDAAMHKVTVTGTVDGDTLVKRLYKSGKQAVPWQHPHVAPVPAPEATKVIEPAPAGDDGGKGDAPAEEEKAAKEAAQAESSEEKKTEQGGESEKKPEAEKEAEKKEEEEAKPTDEAKKDAGGEGEAVPETKAKGSDGAEPELAKEAVPAAAAAKKASNDEDVAKEEKTKLKDAVDAAPPAAATTTTTERSLHFSPAPAHKQHAAHEEHYPYPYYGTPQPVMSYHMAQPTTSVSYYAPRPEPAYSMQQHPPPAYPVQQQQQQYPPPPPSPQPQAQTMQQQWSPSYLYMPYPHSSPDSYYRDYYSPPGTAHAPPLQDEYRMFDDENPNACSVM